jgi:hypothetical protein
MSVFSVDREEQSLSAESGHLVIVGAGPAGLATARAYREGGGLGLVMTLSLPNPALKTCVVLPGAASPTTSPK